MQQGKNTFRDGLNQDTSRSKYSPGNYYYLQNGKIVTEEGLSSGSATNKKGNTLSFKIPSTAPVYEILVPISYTGASTLTFTGSTYSFVVPITNTTAQGIFDDITDDANIQTQITNGNINVFFNSSRIVIVGLDDLTSVTLLGGLVFNTVATAYTDLKICGWENLENSLIVFTTNEKSTDPVNAPGQIWELEYDEKTEAIIGLAGGLLVPSVHLKYNNKLNFSLSYRVGEIIGRYENAKIRTVYFTDNFNLLRTFNLANPDGLALPPQDLDVRADISLSEPTIISIGAGSLSTGSTIQFGYRLKTTNGSTTIISPLTPLVPLADDPTSGNYEDFKGRGYNAGNSRSVTYNIKNIDTSYYLIEHIAIIYKNLDVPEVYIFREEIVPVNGELNVTHDGTEDLVQLTQQELNALSNPFVCKTITAKRNKLIAANLKYKKSELDFDARAYRFLHTGTCALYDKQGNIIPNTTTLAQLSSLSETSDAINPYNDESGTIYNTAPGDPTTWETNYQYKYQSDGITLGGEGANVSYTFINELTRAYENTVGAAPPYVSVSRVSGTLQASNGEVITNQNYFRDFKSPLISTYLKGYKRGEVYRFGITFFDKKGNPFFVKWIGDIRFPECHEYISYGTGSLSSLETIQVGIEFTVDISSIQTEISGFSIVRLEREEEDKTRLGTGTPIGLTNSHNNNQAWYGRFNDPLTENVLVNGVTEGAVYILQDAPQIPSFTSLATGLFPFHQYDNKYAFKSGDYLKESGYYLTQTYCTYFNNAGTSTIGLFYKGHSFNLPTTRRRHKLKEVFTLDYKGTKRANELNGFSLDQNIIVNASYSKANGADKEIPAGLGNKKLLLSLDTTPATGYVNDFTQSDYGSGFGGINFDPTAGTAVGNMFNMKVLDYCRFLTNQYGGASYESRASNTYIPTGHFQFIDNTSTASQTATVYGGDIFTAYYSDEYMTMHWETGGNGTPFEDEVTNFKLSTAIGIPCETHINFNLRHGNTFADNQDYSGSWTQTPYNYNKVYHQNSNTIQQYVSPAIINTSTDEYPHAIIASEEKIDGEAFDAWRIYPTNNYIEVDGNHGDINKIITYRDKVYFYQTRGIGIVSVQERSITQDATGTEVILGTGGILDYYQYITTNSGCFHQFSVISGESGLYHIDTLSRKAMIISESKGVQSISTVEGLSAFFDTTLQGNIQTIDKTLYYDAGVTNTDLPAIGIHGVYDRRNHCIIWTILKGYTEEKLESSLQDSELVSTPSKGSIAWVPDNTTIVYNEMMDSFEEFQTVYPKLWLDNYRRLLSVDPSNQSDGYIHNKGVRGEFYGVIHPFKITVLINTAPEQVKTLDIIEYIMDLIDTSGADIPLETFNTLRIYNSHQDTGTLTLTPQSNIIRTLRKWRINTLRDNSTNKPRLRDYHFFLELTYNNNADKELILHDITHYIRPSNF